MCLLLPERRWGENLEGLERNGFFRRAAEYLSNFGVKPEDIIQPLDAPYYDAGCIAVLLVTWHLKGLW